MKKREEHTEMYCLLLSLTSMCSRRHAQDSYAIDWDVSNQSQSLIHPDTHFIRFLLKFCLVHEWLPYENYCGIHLFAGNDPTIFINN